MTRHVLRRLGAIVILVVVASMLVFLIIHLVPGDPVAMMLGPNAASQRAIERLRVELGLNLPLTTQYIRWAGQILHGDFGLSLINNLPVASLMAENYPSTLVLTLSALVVTVVVGVTFGVIAALRQDTIWDTVAMVLALVGLAMPSFWLGLLLISLFGVTLHVLPVFGGTGPKSLILPAITLGFGSGGVLARFVRSNLLETLHLQHVTVARSKGLPGRSVVSRHVLRNSLVPVITVIGLQIGNLLSGTVVVEEVFSRPGMGRLLVTSILDKDFPTVQAVILVLTIVYALTNLIVDLSYPLLDPRIRYS